MLCLHGLARRRSLVLLDFLAPSLVARTRLLHSNREPSPLQSDDPTFRQLKKQVTQHPLHLPPPQVDLFNTTLLKINQATKRGDINAVITQWRVLRDSKLVHLLTTDSLTKISNLLAQS